jgi:hypothetical protein
MSDIGLVNSVKVPRSSRDATHSDKIRLDHKLCIFKFGVRTVYHTTNAIMNDSHKYIYIYIYIISFSYQALKTAY